MSQVAFSELDQGTKDQMACVFATLLLHDNGETPTEERILEVTKKSGLEVAAYWPGLFLKAVGGRSIDEFLTVSAGGGGGATAGPAEGDAEEEEKEEVVEEEADVSMPDLFGGDDSSSEEESD